MTKRNPLESMNPTDLSSPASTSVIAMIPSARQVKRDAKTEEQIAKRKSIRAKFDQDNPCFGYFIPEHLHGDAKKLRAEIISLAQNKEKNINVTEINMTTSLVEWALKQVRKGNLVLKGVPNARRRKMTVIIEDAPDTWEKKPFEIKPVEKKIPAKRMVFTYRFPLDVDKQITGLASDVLPKGEVLIRLLQYAVKAVKADNAFIRTAPMEMRQVSTIVESTESGDSWT